MIDDIYSSLHVTEASWMKNAALTGAAAAGLFAGSASAAPGNPPETKAESKQSAKEVFANEYDAILKAAVRNGVKENTEDFFILLAIRKAENGRPGREFGILHPRAKDTNLDTQAGWAAATVRKNRERWKKAGSKGDFITFLGNKYCPVGAENDPTGLNKHWIKNVTSWTKKLQQL